MDQEARDNLARGFMNQMHDFSWGSPVSPVDEMDLVPTLQQGSSDSVGAGTPRSVSGSHIAPTVWQGSPVAVGCGLPSSARACRIARR